MLLIKHAVNSRQQHNNTTKSVFSQTGANTKIDEWKRRVVFFPPWDQN